MFIFIRWLLAHLIGDFLLQTDSIHALKYKGLKGNIPHALMIVCSFVILSWPYLDLPAIWLFFLFIGVTHLLQDWAKIRFSNSSRHRFLFYILDQVLHVALISVVFLTPFKYLEPPPLTGHFIAWYNNDTLLISFILAIYVSYNAHYMIILFKKDYFNNRYPYSPFEKWYGMLERTLILVLFLAGGLWLLLIPGILVLRWLLYNIGRTHISTSRQFISITEITLSGMTSVIIGIIAAIII